MMGYKDQTWCTRYSSGECKNKECIFALTEQEQEKAIYWWGSDNFSVMLGDRKTKECGFIHEG